MSAHSVLDIRWRLFAPGLTSTTGEGMPLEPLGSFSVLADVTASLRSHHHGSVIGDTAAFAQALLDRELVGIVPGESFGADGYVRVSYVAEEARLREAIGRLRRFTTALDGQLANPD